MHHNFLCFWLWLWLKSSECLRQLQAASMAPGNTKDAEFSKKKCCHDVYFLPFSQRVETLNCNWLLRGRGNQKKPLLLLLEPQEVNTILIRIGVKHSYKAATWMDLWIQSTNSFSLGRKKLLFFHIKKGPKHRSSGEIERPLLSGNRPRGHAHYNIGLLSTFSPRCFDMLL